jgi:hypothetical protein
MFKPKPITVRGKTYPSHTEAAQALGVTGSTIHKHLKRYGHLDHIGQQKSGVGAPIETTIDGFTFKSIKAAATALNIDAGTLRIYLSEKASQRQKETLQLRVENYRLKNKLKPAQKNVRRPNQAQKFKFDVSGRIEGIGPRTHRITAPTADLAMVKFTLSYQTRATSNMHAAPVAGDTQ